MAIRKHRIWLDEYKEKVKKEKTEGKSKKLNKSMTQENDILSEKAKKEVEKYFNVKLSDSKETLSVEKVIIKYNYKKF